MGTSVTRPRFVALPCINEKQELRDPRDRNGVGLEQLWQKLLKPRSLDTEVCLPALMPLSLSLSVHIPPPAIGKTEFVTIGWYTRSRISVSLTDLSKQNAGIYLSSFLYLSLPFIFFASIRVEEKRV